MHHHVSGRMNFYCITWSMNLLCTGLYSSRSSLQHFQTKSFSSDSWIKFIKMPGFTRVNWNFWKFKLKKIVLYLLLDCALFVYSNCVFSPILPIGIFSLRKLEFLTIFFNSVCFPDFCRIKKFRINLRHFVQISSTGCNRI